MHFHFTKKFKENIIGNHGDAGKVWMDTLPNIVNECERLWDVKAHESHYPLSYNYLTDVSRADGTMAVLKIGFPSDEEILTEMDALRAMNGNKSVRLYQSDTQLAAMLLERIYPGTPLQDIQRKDDKQATLIASEIIRDLPVAVTESMHFPRIADWTEILSPTKRKQFEGSPVSDDVIEKAWNLFHVLDQSKKEEKVLHGDLHHENILLDKNRGWLAIDPKGIIGDPTFNAARFVRNPHFENQMSLVNRIEMVSSFLQVSTQRLAAWGYIDRVISTCWSIQSQSDGWKMSIESAMEFASIAEI